MHKHTCTHTNFLPFPSLPFSHLGAHDVDQVLQQLLTPTTPTPHVGVAADHPVEDGHASDDPAVDGGDHVVPQPGRHQRQDISLVLQVFFGLEGGVDLFVCLLWRAAG
jgi:hypothetical protein